MSSSNARRSVGHELVGRLDPKPGEPERLGQRHQVGVRELGAGEPPELAHLVQLDDAERAVCPHEVHDREPEPLGGLELLDVHQEAAVARDRDDVPLARQHELGGDRRRHGEAHRRGAVRDQDGVRLVRRPEARDPELVRADVRDEDVVGPHHLAQVAQHPLRLHREPVVGALLERQPQELAVGRRREPGRRLGRDQVPEVGQDRARSRRSARRPARSARRPRPRPCRCR